MNEDVSIEEIPLATDLTNSAILGTNSLNEWVRFKLGLIKGDYKGVADSESFNPGTPVLNQYYTALPGITYTNFKDSSNVSITVPVLVAGKAVYDARLSYSGTAWLLSYNTLTIPGDFSGAVAVLAAKLPPTVASKNLFDVTKVQNDMYQPSNGAHYTSQTGWVLSPEIPVSVGITYFISGTITRVGIGMYNAAGTCVRYINQTGGAVTVQAGEVIMVFNLKTNLTGAYSNIQVEVGSSATTLVPYGATLPQSSIAEFQPVLDTINSNAAKLGAVDTTADASLNLFNPATISAGKTLGSTGALATAAAYDTTDFIAATPLKLYTGLNINGSDIFRNYAFYDSNKTFISFNNTAASSFTTDATTAFYRVSVYNGSTKPGYTAAGYGIFLGASPVYQPFGNTYTVKQAGNLPTTPKPDNAFALIGDVKAAAGIVDAANTLTYALAAGNLILTHAFGNMVVGVGNNRGYSGNDVVNFTSFNLASVASSNFDDAAPLHIMSGTYGANHGQPVYNATVTGHGLTNTAIGKYWTDGGGTKFYVMRIVSANVIAFLGQNNGNAADPSFPALAAGTLTRAGDVSLTVSAVNGSQLYSSITNLNKRVLKNGVEAITTSAGTAQFIDVVESYEVMSIDDILNNIIARAGTSPDPVYTGSSMVRVENTYRFLPGAAIIVMVNIKVLQTIAFSNIMASQSAIIGPAGSVQYYVPNSASTPVDLRTPNAVAWSSSIPALFLNVSAAPDPTNPPNRVIQYYNNLGFMLGMLKTRGAGKALQNYTNQTFEIRNDTGKVYPHPVDARVGSVLGANKIYSMAMVRAYTNLAATRSGNRLSYFNFNFAGVEYIFADYSGTMTDKINVGKDSLNGKKITVLEAVNTTLITDTYQDGVYIDAAYVSGQTCFIVLTIG